MVVVVGMTKACANKKEEKAAVVVVNRSVVVINAMVVVQRGFVVAVVHGTNRPRVVGIFPATGDRDRDLINRVKCVMVVIALEDRVIPQ
jgi:hypothetical protein